MIASIKWRWYNENIIYMEERGLGVQGMAKITCEKCGTEFKFEVAKDFESCPVCGASFDDKDTNNEDSLQEDDSGDAVMYFDIIDIFQNEPELQ